MTARHATELLYDSEAALRLVDSAIEDLRDAHPRDAGTPPDQHTTPDVDQLLAAAGALGLDRLTTVLARGYSEIAGELGRLRESRRMLEQTAVAQQATYASSVLSDVEARLAKVAAMLSLRSEQLL